MAATINLHVWTGADANTDGGSADSFSFGTADAATNTAAWRQSNPITIPATACNYSYEKWINACIGASPANSVGNFEYWGTPPAQTHPTGTCWLIGTAACNAGSAPSVTSSSTATTDMAEATSDSKGTWDSASYADPACQTAYLVSQLQVTTTACVGNWGGANGCALSYSYDEQ